MANKLKIYACSGVGSSAGDGAYDYWLDNNSNILRNTQAVNTLFSYIDANYAELTRLNPSVERKIELLNNIDLASICLFYAQEYSNSLDNLKTAGRVIGSLVAKGLFDFGSLDNEERNAHLDELYDKVEEAMLHNDKYAGDSEFNKWWKETVISRNKVGMTESEIKRFEDCMESALAKVGVKGVGRLDYTEYINNAGKYFLYYFFTKKQLSRLPYVFTEKHFGQVEIFNWCKAFYVGVYGSEEDMLQEIRTNIIKEFGVSPEKMCAGIASGKIKAPQQGVGDIAAIITAVAALITAITPIIAAIIYGIFDYCKNADANKYKSLRDDIINDCKEEEEDLDGLEFDTSKISKYLPYIAIGVVGLYLLKD